MSQLKPRDRQLERTELTSTIQLLGPLFATSCDALLSPPMKGAHLILDTPHYCYAAKAHRLIAGQVKLATKSEQVEETLLTLLLTIHWRIRIHQPRMGLAPREHGQQHSDQHQ